MKVLFFILAISMCSVVTAQSNDALLQGSVSYIGTQNVYVSFVNTEDVKLGDSLYVLKEGKLKAVLAVIQTSSISCVCTTIGSANLLLTNKVFAKRVVSKMPELLLDQQLAAVAVNDDALNSLAKKRVNHDLDARVYGRFSASSYSNFTDNTPTFNVDSVNKIADTHRLRYNFELSAEHIANSNLSFESNLSFTHKLNDSTEKYDGLRIFDLAFKYDFSKTAALTAGRKINANMSNIGAVDGLQFEKTFKNFSFGAVAGFRPSDVNYGFDSRLLQYGAFVGHLYQKEEGGYSQSSFAVFNQTNNSVTDRRYLYFQHSNSILKNLDLFCSFEADLYKLDTLHQGFTTDSIPQQIFGFKPASTFDFTGLYASLRYRPWKQLSMTLSYDARNNIYYYETYKNTFNGNFDKMTRQGWKVSTIVRPINSIIWGTSAGYRLNPHDVSASLNGHTYLTYTNIPFINTAITIGATTLKTYAMNSSMYDVSLSRDIFNDRIFLDLQYSLVNYVYNNTNTSTIHPIVFENTTLLQHVATLGLNWRLTKKLMLSADFEATMDAENKYGRMFLNISQRF